MYTQRIKCSIYFLSIAALCYFSSCVSAAHPQSHFPIKVLEGTVQMHIALIPLKSYSDVGRGYDDYQIELRASLGPKRIPQGDHNTSSHTFLQDPRDTRYRKKSDIPAKKNEAEYFVKEITQGNELRWHIPRDFRIEVIITNPYTETAVYECNNKTFQLKTGKKTLLYFYP